MKLVRTGDRVFNLDLMIDYRYTPANAAFRGEDWEPPRFIPARAELHFAAPEGDGNEDGTSSIAPYNVLLTGPDAQALDAWIRAHADDAYASLQPTTTV